MPPQSSSKGSWILFEADSATEDKFVEPLAAEAKRHVWEVVWRNVVLYVLIHSAGLYGAYLFCTEAMWRTRLFAYVLYLCSGLGITAGVHRLWSHRAYKAALPLRVLLMLFNSSAFQDSVIHWARDHRMHHKYSETDADPHNATRGFFFSHVGWLLVRKHPDLLAAAPTIDVSDLWSDPVLRFQKRLYYIIMPLTCFVLPTYIPTLWGESLWTAFFVSGMFRFVWVLNATWFINSAAHKWGNKPYDKSIRPVETTPLCVLALGEGFHNFHHTFPWDYKTGELSGYHLNFTKLFIDAMAAIGWAYDLKNVDPEVVRKRVRRTGDGSRADDDDGPKNIFFKYGK